MPGQFGPALSRAFGNLFQGAIHSRPAQVITDRSLGYSDVYLVPMLALEYVGFYGLYRQRVLRTASAKQGEAHREWQCYEVRRAQLSVSNHIDLVFRSFQILIAGGANEYLPFVASAPTY